MAPIIGNRSGGHTHYVSRVPKQPKQPRNSKKLLREPPTDGRPEYLGNKPGTSSSCDLPVSPDGLTSQKASRRALKAQARRAALIAKYKASPERKHKEKSTSEARKVPERQGPSAPSPNSSSHKKRQQPQENIAGVEGAGEFIQRVEAKQSEKLSSTVVRHEIPMREEQGAKTAEGSSGDTDEWLKVGDDDNDGISSLAKAADDLSLQEEEQYVVV